MLSKKQQRRLIRATYGTSAEFIKSIKRMYRNANRQIKGEISAFLADEVNWSAPAEKSDVKDAVEELQGFDASVAPLAAFYASSLLLGHPKQSDLLTARVAVPMIKVGQSLHSMMNRNGSKIPNDVSKISKAQQVATPTLHNIPYNYDVMLQRSVSRAVTQREGVGDRINQHIHQTITRITNVCQEASQNTDAKKDYTKVIDRILNGKNGFGGSEAQAETIMRTQTCRELNNSTIADFQARGVEQYRFLSLEAVNSCQDCTDLDGNVYNVEDAQEGVNLPPMHPNCQCWIEEVEDATDDYGSGSDLEITEDS